MIKHGLGIQFEERPRNQTNQSPDSCRYRRHLNLLIVLYILPKYVRHK